MTTFLIIWFSLGLIAAPLTYGMSLAYWWHEWRQLQSKEYANGCIACSLMFAFYALVAPIHLITYYFLTDRARHGLLFRNPAKYL